MPLVSETVTWLEMLSPADLRPKPPGTLRFELTHAQVPCPELSRFFYGAVGGDWYWTDRLPWNYEQWDAWVHEPGYELWIAAVRGTPAGYFELVGGGGEPVNLGFFGLLPQFTGQGLGGPLLTRAVERAWAKDATRVWLHTCTHDHPNALANYLARGFRVVSTETSLVDKPAQPVGVWPGWLTPSAR